MRGIVRELADLQVGSKVILFGITFEQLASVICVLVLVPSIYLWYHNIHRGRSIALATSGCTRLGLTGKSNNADEFDAKYDSGTKDQQKWRIKTIYIHPIKSCAPIELSVADVDAEGLTYDRKFAIAELLKPTITKPGESTEPKWTFRTLRQPGYERLALVRPEIWVSRRANADATGRKLDQDGVLVVRYPIEPTGIFGTLDRFMMSWGLIPKENAFHIPLNVRKGHKYPKEVVNIWKDDMTWINLGEHVPEDFKQWLRVKNPLSLFQEDPEHRRELYRCAPKKEDIGFQPAVRFQDAYPVQMLNLASVHDVGNKIKGTIDGLSVRRFRGNFIIEGPPMYDEDDWKRIKIGGHELYCSCHTLRCRLPNVDPDTAVRHPVEPDKTLKSFRCIDPGDPTNAALGMMMVPATNERFQIRVGDRVEVLERGEHSYLKQ